jgi:ribose 5-phosphate isomerase B
MMSRRHNDTNMLSMGSRIVGTELAKMIMDCWLDGEFEAGRHADRVAIFTKIEENQPID